MVTGRKSADADFGNVQRSIRQNIIQQCYEPLSRKLLDRNGWEDEIELAAGSEVTAEAHENRTVLELVQNARDAIRKARSSTDGDDRDGSVAVVVGPETLYIANTGEPFHLDDEKVLKRVRRLGQGKEDEESIGEKGVGMRSILTLGERFGVHSTFPHDASKETFSVEFTSAHPWAMLMRRYSEILTSREKGLRDRITESLSGIETLETYADCLECVVKRMDTERAESLALAEYDDWPDAVAITDAVSNGQAPSPANIIEGLPELSAFKYPLIRDRTINDPVIRTLLGQGDVETQSHDVLANKLSENHYTTVVSVDYKDAARGLLFELFAETFGDTEENLDLPVEEWREAAETEAAHSERQKQIWDECQETLSQEVLVLLGEIETIDLIRLADSGELDIEASERYHCQIQDSDVDSLADKRNLQLQRLTVSCDDASASSDVTSSEFHLYTKEWDHPATDEKEDNRLRLLFEEPGEGNDWRPAPQPLHLYYPIENETTPFPFILHAPFKVQMDRQNLDNDNEKNAALLDEGTLQEFVIETIEIIVDSESPLRSWLPWLVMPLAVRGREPNNRNSDVSNFIMDLRDKLSSTSCVPTFGGSTAPPDYVLLEVSEVSGFRLEAFDPLREYLDRHDYDEHRRLPAQEVVKNGRRWLQTIEEEEVLEPGQFRDAAEGIGLTKLLDRLPGGDHGDDKKDFISVLGDIWGVDAASAEGNPDIALKVQESKANAYFETIINRLPDEKSGPARELGKRHIPLIPALDYSGEQEGLSNHTSASAGSSASCESIGRLVRAIDRTSESALKQDRIVFREDSRQTQRTIGPPPEPFRVYLVPYRKGWHDALDSNAEEWGTSKFERDTDIYRRVAAELGGYGEDDLALDDSDASPLDYLYNGYTQINRGRQDPSAGLFVPIPYQGWHYHKTFSDSVDTAGIGNLLQWESFDPISDDNYLYQLYIKQIQVPTRGGDWKPADQIVFGSDWAEPFRSVADQLDQAESKDPFADKRIGDTDAANDFRRWATAIECAAQIRDDSTDILAVPEELRNYLGLSANGSGRLNEPDGEEWFWLINFLLHLGVQIGPRIEWAWLNPVDEAQASDRRPRALFLEEARQLSNGSLPETDLAALPVTPTHDELHQYADVCQQAHNHPAFVVNHAPNCEEAAFQSYDDWLIEAAANGSGSVAIPMWWRFANPPSNPTVETARLFRNAVLLLWPELSDRLFPTGWACTGAFSSSHQVKSPRKHIPSLGVVQLRQAAIWPSSNATHDEVQSECLPAMDLVDGKRVSALRQIDRDLLEEAWPSELEQVGDSLSLANVASEGELQRWLAISISDFSPAAAAERLDALLNRFTSDSAAASGGWYSQVRDDAFKLLRRFSPANQLDMMSDDDTKRQWIRRDIYYAETQLMVDKRGKPDTIRIGDGATADAMVYREALPDYAEEQLHAREVTFVKLPTTNPRPIAGVLADRNDSVDPVRFGIKDDDVPTRPTVSGDFERTSHSEVSQALSKRVADLAAAYAIESTERTPEDVQHIEKQLDRAAENVCEISTRDIDGNVRGVTSVKWMLDSSAGVDTDRFGIALVKEEIGGEPKPYHAVDALVDIVENEAVKDKFEVVLRAEPDMERYVDTRAEYGLGNIERNELQRFLQSSLPAIATGLSQLLVKRNRSLVSYEFDEPEDETTVKAHHKALRAFVIDGTYDEIVAQYTSELTRGSLNQDQAKACIRAAVFLAFERDYHAAFVILVNLLSGTVPDVGAGIAKMADEVDEVHFGDWRTFNATNLQQYLTATAIVEEFYSLLEPGHDESDIQRIATTVLSRVDMLSSSPLEPIEDAVPEAVLAELGGDQSLPILVFALLDEIENPPLDPEQYPEKLAALFSEWCQDQYADTVDVVAVSLEDWRLCDQLNLRNMEESLSAVKATLDSKEQSTARQQQRTRKKKERAFDQGKWSSDAEISVASAGNDLDFPEVNDGSRNDADSREFTGGDGRAGELYCIDKAWERFQSAGTQQSSIVQAVSKWRNKCNQSDQWRLKQTADVFSEEEALTDTSGEFAFEKLCDRMCDDGEDWQQRRKWFRMLVDVSEERGPGFDYIDPFGTAYDPKDNVDKWEPEWMRRVEVKSINGTPRGSYRVTLTGNEFRMARRSCEVCDGRRYLVRLVFGTQHESEFQPLECRDIDDILTAYSDDADDSVEAETQAWDALRGGEVPLRGSLE